MKTLTIEHRNKNDIDDLIIAGFEDKMKVKFPYILSEFLKKYSGSSIIENTYKNEKTGNYYILSYICELFSELNPSIEKLIKGNEFYSYHDWIPFGIDPGGWVFNLSISNDKMEQVWINKFDSGDKYPFEFVASSFEEFIDNLRTEEEAFNSPIL